MLHASYDEGTYCTLVMEGTCCTIVMMRELIIR